MSEQNTVAGEGPLSPSPGAVAGKTGNNDAAQVVVQTLFDQFRVLGLGKIAALNRSAEV